MFNTANVGGIFGLCLGGSIISLIEMGYFLLFRMIGRMFMQFEIKSNEFRKVDNLQGNKQFPKTINSITRPRHFNALYIN